MEIQFLLNQNLVKESLPPQLLLLDYLRNHQRLSATKEGCKEGDCGACTVLIGRKKGNSIHYEPQTSCLLPVGSLWGAHVVTLEGINLKDLNPIQKALYEEGGSQCGYCTPGFVVSLMWFVLESHNLSLSGWKEALGGNLCRCTGYGSIKRAGEKVITYLKKILPQVKNLDNRLPVLVEKGFLPSYFTEVPTLLERIPPFNKNFPQNGDSDHLKIAGGTDVYVQKGDAILEKEVLLLAPDSNLKGISREKDRLRIGSGTTFFELENHPEIQKWIPKIKEYMALIASIPIRSRATIGGNIGNASPIGDITIMLLALEAKLELLKGKDFQKIEHREILLKNFFLGYKKLALEKGEIIGSIWIPLWEKETYFHFEKVSKRKHLDIASVNSAIKIQLNEEGEIKKAAVAMGGVAPIPLFLEKTSEFLQNKPLEDQVVQKALDILEEEISPISDIRGSKEYKTMLAKNLFLAHFLTLFPNKIQGNFWRNWVENPS